MRNQSEIRPPSGVSVVALPIWAELRTSEACTTISLPEVASSTQQGAPELRADFGVKDGRIAALGGLAGSRAGTVIAAEGRIVCPGFIDMHSHDWEWRSFADFVARMPRLGLNVAQLVGHVTVRVAAMGVDNRAPNGVDIVLVNGVPVVSGGASTGATPGAVLRHRG